MKVIRDREQAEEAAQDVFVKAFKKLSTFEERSSFKTWLYRIAYHTAIDYQRKKQTRQHEVSWEVENLGHADRALTAQQRLEAMDDRQWLHRGISQLSADQAAIITLFYLEEKSVREVCEVTGLTESNVKIKLFRARNKLRQILVTQNGGDGTRGQT